LSKEIQTVNDLQRKHVDCLIKNIVIPFDEKVIQLWSKTAKISAIGSKNEGNLTEKWKKEEKEKRLKIREYVREHGVDAKFSPRAKHKFEKRAKRMDRFRLLQSAIASQLQLSPMNSPKTSQNLCKSSIPQLNDNIEYKSSPLKPANIDAEIEIDLNDFSLDKSNDALLNDLTRNNFENEEINENNNNDNDNKDDINDDNDDNQDDDDNDDDDNDNDNPLLAEIRRVGKERANQTPSITETDEFRTTLFEKPVFLEHVI